MAETSQVTFICDTSVVVDVLRGVGAAAAWITSLPGRPICSEVTRAEVIRGMGSAERADTEILFRRMGWAAVDEAISRRAGDVGRAYRRSHPGIGVADLIVAATALEFGLEMATINVRHFPMFKGLRPPYHA